MFQIHDSGLGRSRAVHERWARQVPRVVRDREVVKRWWSECARTFTDAWSRAGARRVLMRQFRRSDAKLLADIGIDYPNLRDEMDLMVQGLAGSTPGRSPVARRPRAAWTTREARA